MATRGSYQQIVARCIGQAGYSWSFQSKANAKKIWFNTVGQGIFSLINQCLDEAEVHNNYEKSKTVSAKSKFIEEIGIINSLISNSSDTSKSIYQKCLDDLVKKYEYENKLKDFSDKDSFDENGVLIAKSVFSCLSSAVKLIGDTLIGLDEDNASNNAPSGKMWAFVLEAARGIAAPEAHGGMPTGGFEWIDSAQKARKTMLVKDLPNKDKLMLTENDIKNSLEL